MRKVETKNKAKGLFGFFATIALALGVGVSLAPKETVKTQAASEYSYTIAKKEWDSYGTSKKLGGVSWTLNGIGGTVQNYDGSSTNKGQQFGSKNSPTTKLNLKTTDISGTISNVKITTSGAADVKSNVSVKVGGISFLTNSNATATLTESSKEFSFLGSSSGEIDVEWNTSARAVYLKKIVVTYETAPLINVESVTVSPVSDSIFVGGTTQLNAEVLPSGAPEGIEWSTGDSSVATVNSSGLVSAVGVGDAIITATSTADKTKSGKATIHVSPVSVSSVSLNKKSVELYEGKTETLTATVLPANATNKNVSWTVQDDDVVTVNNGLLTAVGAGTTTVSVSTEDGEKTDSATVTVLANPITTLTVNYDSVKKAYALGESFDGFAGLVVKEKRASGEETVITDYSISTIDTMELGKQVVRVEKGSFHDEFVINVTNEGAKVGTVEKLAKDLFFSEYIEGSGNNKALEIYNGTGKAVDLSNYQVSQYKDGNSTTNQTLQLSGTLSDGDVYVIAADSANNQIKAAADLLVSHTNSNSPVHFNGNDAIVLQKNYTAIDVIGYIGDNFTWEVGIGATAEYTLVRKETVYEGFIPTIDYADSIENEDEWMVYAQDTTTYLGSHVFAGGTVVGDVTYEEQALAFARFVGRAASAGTEGKGLRKSLLGPATQVAPTWEEVQEEKGAMDPESLVVFETSTDPEIAAGREVYGELLEENESAFADASAFHAYIMGLTSEGDVSTVDCAANFELAKEEWNKLSEEAREVFLDASNTGYAEGRSRLLHWTFVNGWEFNGVVLQEQALGGRSTLNKDSVNFNIVATVLIGVIGLTTLAGYYFLRKKKHA